MSSPAAANVDEQELWDSQVCNFFVPPGLSGFDPKCTFLSVQWTIAAPTLP